MKLRGALLGAGNIAQRGHLPQWAHDPVLREEVEIVAISDLAPANLEAALAFFPAATPYARAEDLLDHETLDLCDICTPPFSHGALIGQAARNGVNVLCEKPLAPNLAEAEGIAEAVAAAGITFQPCHQHHHSPQWQAVLSLLPRLGRVYLAEYEVERTEANPGNSHWSPDWRTDHALAGGGILVDHGTHIFYQLRAALGEPTTVQAVVRTLQHQSYGVEDTALIVLDFGHCFAQVNLTWAARRRAIRYRFVGERGELTGDDGSVQIRAERDEEARFDSALSADSSHSEWYAPLFRDFVARVRSGDRNRDGLDESVYVARVITRAYESAASGRSLPLEPPVATLLRPDDPEAEPGLPPPEAGRAPVDRWRRRAFRAATAAALVGAAAWTFHDVSWAPLHAALASTQLGWVGLAAAVNIAAVAFQAARWQAVVRPLSRAATWGSAFTSMIVGFAVSTVVPARAGEIARVRWLSRRTGLSYASVTASVLVDHLVNATGLLAGLAVLPFFLKTVPLWIRPGAWFTLALFGVGTTIVLAVRQLLNAQRIPATSVPAPGIQGFLVTLRNSLVATTRPGALGLSLAASLGSWMLEVNVTTLTLRAMGLALPVSAALLVLLAVNLALAFPLAPPGNLGTLEVGATLALLAFGVPKEQALAFGIVYHFLQIIPIAALGVFFASRSAHGVVAR